MKRKSLLRFLKKKEICLKYTFGAIVQRSKKRYGGGFRGSIIGVVAASGAATVTRR